MQSVHTTRRSTFASRLPSDALVHPITLGALALLVMNDHYLKWQHPGFITGKLSDAVGLILTPIVLTGVLALIVPTSNRRIPIRKYVPMIAVVLTVVVFTAVKISPAIADYYSTMLGVGPMLMRLPMSLVSHGTVPPLVPLRVRADITDLVTLPAVCIAWFVLQRGTAGHGNECGDTRER